jgi:hypothetical protein
MGRKAHLVGLVAVGFGLVTLSVAADAIGIGSDYGFGWEQKVGVAAGTALIWFSSLHLAGWRPRSRREQEHTAPDAPQHAATATA